MLRSGNRVYEGKSKFESSQAGPLQSLKFQCLINLVDQQQIETGYLKTSISYHDEVIRLCPEKPSLKIKYNPRIFGKSSKLILI
ncbi:MAG: hypothetical protein FRX48_03953 [Lasallia pustulata]|uniref:Uncharacterized protein n=1 Tax=Lasallia pustulata TaxID=136370 RepID=A0A5M8PQI2_9LECA|nr:MAG: hypothetical protein FRX48_03953 [Lasallia pustulata]